MGIVVIDDSASALMILEYLCSSEGCKVFGFTSSMDAEIYLEQHRANVIVMDCSMPYLDGIDFVKILRRGKINSRTPILMVTNKTDSQTRALSREAGVTMFMTKPLQSADFKAALKKLMMDAADVESMDIWAAPEQEGHVDLATIKLTTTSPVVSLIVAGLDPVGDGQHRAQDGGRGGGARRAHHGARSMHHAGVHPEPEAALARSVTPAATSWHQPRGVGAAGGHGLDGGADREAGNLWTRVGRSMIRYNDI
jgi:CheY-like chemotaxis protein